MSVSANFNMSASMIGGLDMLLLSNDTAKTYRATPVVLYTALVSLYRKWSKTNSFGLVEPFLKRLNDQLLENRALFPDDDIMLEFLDCVYLLKLLAQKPEEIVSAYLSCASSLNFYRSHHL